MLAKILSAALVGLDALPVEVEVDIASQGLPNFFIVGLPDKAVEEAKERVRSAIRNSGAEFPARRITVNLAPADLPKEGPTYDLPIALGILLASGQLQAKTDNMLFTGELSLDGRIRPGNGILLQALMAKQQKISSVFVPFENAHEAGVINGLTIYPVNDLLSIFHHLSNQVPIPPLEPLTINSSEYEDYDFEMKDIKGQQKAKRAMEIAHAYS